MFIGLAVVAAAWGMLGAAAAQPRPDVTMWVEGDSVTAGEPFTLNIEGSTPAHRGIAFPAADADTAFGDLEVLDRSTVHTRRVGGGYAIDSVAYTMRTSARDSVAIPGVPIRVDVGAGTLTTHTEPRTVWVKGGGPAPFLSSAFGEGATGAAVWWGLVGVIVLGLAGGAYVVAAARTAGPTGEEAAAGGAAAPGQRRADSYETACRRLNELQSQALTSPDAVEAFYEELDEAVCAYLSQRLGIATAERTTGQILSVLECRTDVPAEAVDSLRTALEQADLVKFAGARPDPSTADAAVQAARDGIDAIEEAVAPASASEGTPDTGPGAR